MSLFVAFEILGTIAFAVSGAVVAISKKMDIFGVAILGMTTAVGGGILRDLILGITPPAAFQSPGYALTSIAVSMLVFLPPVRRLLHWNEKLYDTALLLFDAIGLGIFTVIGVQTAYIATGELNAFLAIFVGVVTGCGGGVYIYRTGSVCDLSGGRIENNTAKTGGGIYINGSNSGKLNLSGAPVVKNNTVSGVANNVYLPSGKTLHISGVMS